LHRKQPSKNTGIHRPEQTSEEPKPANHEKQKHARNLPESSWETMHHLCDTWNRNNAR
jgi:hypothetical protein